MATIHCNIVSAEEEIFSGEAEMVIAHGSAGDLGVGHGHAPLLTGLEPGPVRVLKTDGEEDVIYVSGGFFEVQPSGVTILADTAVRAGDLDEAAALEERDDSESAEALQNGGSSGSSQLALLNQELARENRELRAQLEAALRGQQASRL